MLVYKSYANILKRISSITLIAILLLNTMGYYVILIGMQYEHDLTMTKALDINHYEVSQEVTLKLPMSVPYMQNNDDFVRVDGVIEHGGEHYRLVKQKYANDTLTIVCIRDAAQKRIADDMANYVNTFADNVPGHNGNVKQSITFIKDFLPQYTVITSLTLGWESNIPCQRFSSNMIASFEASIIHPPENQA